MKTINKHEDGTYEEIKAGKVGYIKSLMIVIFKNI